MNACEELHEIQTGYTVHVHVYDARVCLDMDTTNLNKLHSFVDTIPII